MRFRSHIWGCVLGTKICMWSWRQCLGSTTELMTLADLEGSEGCCIAQSKFSWGQGITMLEPEDHMPMWAREADPRGILLCPITDPSKETSDPDSFYSKCYQYTSLLTDLFIEHLIRCLCTLWDWSKFFENDIYNLSSAQFVLSISDISTRDVSEMNEPQQSCLWWVSLCPSKKRILQFECPVTSFVGGVSIGIIK